MDKHILDTFSRNVAEKNGWSVQPDQELLKDVLDGLVKNRDRYGALLCPCRDSWGDKDLDRDIICPCIYAKEDIQEFGRCYCALFCRKGSDGFVDTYVKDRRPDELYP